MPNKVINNPGTVYKGLKNVKIKIIILDKMIKVIGIKFGTLYAALVSGNFLRMIKIP